MEIRNSVISKAEAAMSCGQRTLEGHIAKHSEETLFLK